MSVDQIKMRKRQCMVVSAYYPLAETRVQREAEALLDHGYDVDVICLRLPQEAEYEVVRGVNVYRLPVQRGSWHGMAARLREYGHFFFGPCLSSPGCTNKTGTTWFRFTTCPIFWCFRRCGQSSRIRESF